MKMSEYNSMLTTKKDHHFLKLKRAPQDPTDLGSIQFENRKCLGCSIHFKVMVSSKQLYHNSECQAHNTGKGVFAWKRSTDANL
jgi:hypothetical protein